jgi:hypothetical protein
MIWPFIQVRNLDLKPNHGLSRSQFRLKLIAEAQITVKANSHERASRPNMIGLEDDRDEEKTEQSSSRVKLIAVKDNPDQNKTWWMTIETEIDTG